jgi:hypothetical protein
MGVKIISWKEIRAIRGKFQGEDDLEELPHIYMNTNCQRQEVHIGIIFRWCIAKIFKINFTIKGIWLNIQFEHHARKRILGSSNNRQIIMQSND